MRALKAIDRDLAHGRARREGFTADRKQAERVMAEATETAEGVWASVLPDRVTSGRGLGNKGDLRDTASRLDDFAGAFTSTTAPKTTTGAV